MKIYNIILEDLKERYCGQTNRWIKDAMLNRGHEVLDIYGLTLTNIVETGKVLDANSTIFFKMSQISKIAEMFYNKEIKKGDVFFLHDLWMPGCESIRYMSMLNNIPVYIFGWMHAGSWTRGDFMEPGVAWGANIFELGFLTLCDGVFVGSQYHKDKLLRLRVPDSVQEEYEKKIFVSGNPCNSNEVIGKYSEKEDIVIWPHRFDAEKGADILFDIITNVFSEKTNTKFLICNSRPSIIREDTPEYLRKKLELFKKLMGENLVIEMGIPKQKYYDNLSKSKVFLSTTIEENFGYALAESLANDCYPVVPNDFSHREILMRDDLCLYNSIDEATSMILHAFNCPRSPGLWKEYIKPYDRSARLMVDCMEDVVNRTHKFVDINSYKENLQF